MVRKGDRPPDQLFYRVGFGKKTAGSDGAGRPITAAHATLARGDLAEYKTHVAGTYKAFDDRNSGDQEREEGSSN